MLDDLLNKYAPANSKLAIRCREKPKFAAWLGKMIVELRKFYSQMQQPSALQVFESRLNRWLKDPDSDYMSFVGEMAVTKRLADNHILHHFIPETATPTPDIALEISGQEIYFEVATIQEDAYYEFGEAVAGRLKPLFPQYYLRIMPLYVKIKDEEILINLAVKAIEEALLKSKKLIPIEYDGDAGIYGLTYSFHPITSGKERVLESTMRVGWEEARVSKDGIPFIQQKLRLTLKDKQQQFISHKPTFLVWINFDNSLFDIPAHVMTVLMQDAGAKYSNVSGIIVDGSFIDWTLLENEFNPDYPNLKSNGVFEKIQAF